MAAFAAPAVAQFGGMLTPPANILQGSAFITQNDLTRMPSLREKRLAQARKGPVGGASAEQASTLAGPASASVSEPASLAKNYPPASRAKAEKLFRDLLAGYSDIERRFDIPHRDAAGAVAAFLAGSFMAYRNVDFPDEQFRPLVEQMRRVLLDNPQFQGSTAQERQALWERLAILGMFMAGSQMALKESPDPELSARMQASARAYLEAFSKTDASRVQMTSDGLQIR